jgi:hypothetical protein
VYSPDYDPPEETLVIDLEKGEDITYHVPVSDIQLRSAAQ